MALLGPERRRQDHRAAHDRRAWKCRPRGDVFIRGQRVNDLSVQQRNIGFVFQNYALFKNMNVFKNIAFGLEDQEVETRPTSKRASRNC